MNIPVLALLFVSFVSMVILRTQPSIIHAAQTSIQFDLNENANFAWAGLVPFEAGRFGFKTLFDVNTVADFWSWATMGLVPLLFPETWDVNEVRNNVLAACEFAAAPIAGWGFNTSNVS